MEASRHIIPKANKTDAGNGSKAICRVSNVLRSPSPDPSRSAKKPSPMTIPDGRAYDSPAPAFLTVEQFRSCSRMVLGGDTVDCAVERIGGYRNTSEVTELTDILFGDEDLNEHVFPLVRGDYDVLRIVDCPERPNIAENVYFTMIALCGAEPVTWQRFPKGYGSDAYNMTVISPECRRRIVEIIRPDDYSEYWNPMCHMVLCYNESYSHMFEALGVHLSPPDGFGEAVLTPTSKVARFFLGYSAGHELIAIQGRWL